MSPRNGELAQIEGEGPSRPSNPSLRSFFPLEVVNLIHEGLDLPSLAALSRVSSGSLQEVSSILYRNVVIRSERGLISFTYGAHLTLNHKSRLLPFFSLLQVRTIEFCDFQISTKSECFRLTADLTGLPYPPRLSSVPLPLQSLIFHQPSSPDHDPLETLFYLIFPHLYPRSVQAVGTRRGYPRPIVQVPWWTTLGAWGNDFASLECINFLPILSSSSTSFLNDMPRVLQRGGAFELTLILSGSPVFDRLDLTAWFWGWKLFRFKGLRTKVVVRKEFERKWREGVMEKLTEEERGRVELEVVD